MKRCEVCRKKLEEQSQHTVSKVDRSGTLVVCLKCKQIVERVLEHDARVRDTINKKLAESVADLPAEERETMLKMIETIRAPRHKIEVLKKRGPTQDDAPKLKYKR